jgi:D-alanyl-D-alanine carboxypeptidase
MRRVRAVALAGGLIFVAVALFSASGSAARTRAAVAGKAVPGRFSTATQRALTDIAVSGMGAASIPGMEVGVWVPGRGSFVRALGTSNALSGAPLSLNDHFRIASISKSFTATTTLRLVDQHRLSLSADVNSYVAGIPNGNRITIAQLLNMTSGIYDYTDDTSLVRAYTRNPARPFGLKDVLASIRRHKPLFAPGTDIRYDNSNYYLLGVIISRVAHESLPRLIKSEILDPLRMTHTSFPTSTAIPAPFSHGYRDQPNFPLLDVTRSNPAFAGGAGGMISTLGDLRIWAKALATGSLLTSASRILQQHTRVLSKSPKVTVRYGMGFTNINGLLGHDGAIEGYGSAMFYLPGAKATIVLLANNNDFNAPTPLLPAVAIADYLFPKQFPHGL